MRTIVSTLAGLLLTIVAAFADPVGVYNVKGKNPNGTEYRGVATVERTGQTYRVTWVIGRTQFTGTAIGDKDFVAVSYQAGDKTGLALYGASGQDWEGIWTFSGGRDLGVEVWERR